MARKSIHERLYSKSPAERTVGETALSTGDFSMLPQFAEGGDLGPIGFLNSYFTGDKFKERYLKNNTQEDYKKQKSFIDQASNNYHPVTTENNMGAEIGSQAFLKNVPGYYDGNDIIKTLNLPKETSLLLDKTQVNNENKNGKEQGFMNLLNGVLPHEYSHSLRRLSNKDNYEFAKRNKLPIPDGWDEKNQKPKTSSVNRLFLDSVDEGLRKKNGDFNHYLATHTAIPDGHDARPDENYSDLNTLRYLMYKTGHYDTRKGNLDLPTLQKALNDPKLKNDFNVKRLTKLFTPLQIMDLNNSVAYNTNQQSETFAKEGGEINSNNMNTRIGKKMAEGGGVGTPITVDNNVRGEWNNYVSWLGTTGKKGLPDLDKNGMGYDMLDQYRKINPKTILTKDYVLPIQKDFQQYRNWSIDQHKAGKLKLAGDPGANYENFMPELSIEDGYPGSKTTSHTFPNAYMQSTDENGKTSTMNKGFAASAVAKMEHGGVFSENGLSGGDAAQGVLGALPGMLTMFDPNADATTKDSGIGGGVGTIAGTLVGGPIGGAIGGLLGTTVGGLIGKKHDDRLKKERFDETNSRIYNKLNLGYNANPTGDNNSFYAEEGGQPDNAMQQQSAMTKVNIEKGELAVNPDNLEITRKFDNKNRFAKHAKTAFHEPIGNHIELPDNNIIIPKKLAKTYEQGSNITRKSILAQLLKDQVNREHAEGAEQQFADGGKPYMLKSSANQMPPLFPDWTGGYQQPDTMGELDPVTVSGVSRMPKGIDYGTAEITGVHNPLQTDFHENKGFQLPTIKVPHVSAVGAAQALNLAPTLYGLSNAFGDDPFLQYNENNGFARAQSDIEQTPTDINMEGPKAAMMKTARGYSQQLNNVNSPSIRAESASNFGKVIEATGQLYANADNERKNRISQKLGQLAGLKVQQGADQEQARERFSTELRMDKANREGLIQRGLSEGATNIGKQVMDNERIRSLNSIAKYFQLDPTGKQLMKENPDAVQHIIDQLEGGTMPNFAVAEPKGKASTTTIRDARGRVKQTSETVKGKQ